MIPKPVLEIAEADLTLLIANRQEESTTLEFKRDIVGNDRDATKEFIADVCAMANTKGGDLVFGVLEDTEGCAASLAPIQFNPDDVVTRLTNILNDGLEPKLHGVVMRAVPIAAGRFALVLRVPRSYSGIHRSARDAHFWVRETRSKRSLDVPGIVSRVGDLIGREDRISDFFARRYAAIGTGGYPLRLKDGPKLVIHIVPTRDILSGEEVDLTRVQEAGDFYVMPANRSSVSTHTFEGVLQHHTPNEQDGTVRAATLMFRSGVVESVATITLHSLNNGPEFIPIETLEDHACQFLAQALPVVVTRMGVGLPLTVRFALVGATQHSGRTSNRNLIRDLDFIPLIQVHSPALVYPDILFEELPASMPLKLEPTFNRIWQTWGYSRSYSFSRQGAYVMWRGQQLQ